MESKFLEYTNINKVSGILGRPSHEEMKRWAYENNLNDYESVTSDLTETLNFINNKFINTRRFSLRTTTGKYPKILIDSIGSYNSIYGYKGHDIKPMQNIIKADTRKTFLSRRIAMHSRNCDYNVEMGETHDNIQRGYAGVSISSPFS